MGLEINTVRKFLCTLSIGVALLLGMSISASAQGRHNGPPPWARANGRRYDRPYGETVSARRHARNELRRELRRDQRNDRRIFNSRLRYERRVYDNNPNLRYQRRVERRDLILSQRAQREALRRTWRNRERH